MYPRYRLLHASENPISSLYSRYLLTFKKLIK